MNGADGLAGWLERLKRRWRPGFEKKSATTAPARETSCSAMKGRRKILVSAGEEEEQDPENITAQQYEIAVSVMVVRCLSICPSVILCVAC